MSSNHKEVLAEISEDLQQWAIVALNATQLKAINYVRGDADGRTQQGARIRRSKSGSSYYWYSPTLPRRQAHPGLWADVTGLTADRYGYEEPEVTSEGIVGSLFNVAPHADKLEGKRRAEGGTYWVLGGLLRDSNFDSDFSLALTFEREFNALVAADD